MTDGAWQVPTNLGDMEPQELIDQLMYASYRHNREIAPHIAVEDFAKLYPNADALERRYQREINAYADTMITIDKAQRHAGRPEHDLDCQGMPLKAGT